MNCILVQDIGYMIFILGSNILEKYNAIAKHPKISEDINKISTLFILCNIFLIFRKANIQK